MEYWKLCKLNVNGAEILEGGWIHSFGFGHCYIGTVLSEAQMKRWRYNTPIFISAQTGTGKSTLVLKGLSPIMKERGKRILILCSRIALKRQYKHNAIKIEEPENEGDWTEKGLDKKHSIGNCDIYSYQEFFLLLTNGNVKKYGAVIFDECHFFVSDASFNQFTQKILNEILHTQRHAIRIYMTATPDDVFDQLLKQEKEIRYMVDSILYNQRKRLSNNVILCDEEEKPHVKIYNFKRDYSYLNPLFFKDSDKLIQMIKSETNDQKWLVFVSNKKAGKEIAKIFGEDLAEYIDAEMKEGEKKEELESIIRNRSFQKKVLIVTKFMDVGVDLCDEAIKNIVIFPTNKTDFLQMIGRKRVKKGEHIKLYIHVCSIKDYSKSLNSLKQKYRNIIDTINSRNEIKLESELEFPLYLVRNNNGLLLEYNGLSAVCIKQNITELQRLLDLCIKWKSDKGVDEIIARYYLEWIDKEEQYDSNLWIDGAYDEIVEQIVNYINPIVGHPLTVEEFEKIKLGLLEIYNTYADQNNLEPIRKDRREKGLSVEAIRKFFSAIHIPFTLSGKKAGHYTFERGGSV